MVGALADRATSGLVMSDMVRVGRRIVGLCRAIGTRCRGETEAEREERKSVVVSEEQGGEGIIRSYMSAWRMPRTDHLLPSHRRSARSLPRRPRVIPPP